MLAGIGAPAAPTTAHAANLLSGSGFESGTLSGWSCSGSTGSVVSSPAHGGTKALAGGASESSNARCSQTVSVQPNTDEDCGTVPDFVQAAPYLYLGWGDPPSATGIKWYTMAFILAQNGCNPAWDSQRSLTGGVNESTINAIRAAGGDIVPSIGSWSGNKLGPNCSTPEALAGAYQKVIDAYDLKAIDVDIENTDEFENPAVQDRILNALKIVKQNNAGLRTILTFPTLNTGPNSWGNRLIEQANALQADIDNFTIMPFNFGGHADIYGSTVNATEGLKNKLKSVFGWSGAEAYALIGISGMNGNSDTGEVTTRRSGPRSGQSRPPQLGVHLHHRRIHRLTTRPTP